MTLQQEEKEALHTGRIKIFPPWGIHTTKHAHIKMGSLYGR
uniref:Uncharacterized protein n=1 Tax=Rhizophora mucronata TaxID=61149 RepID=A0A2P2QHJ9_RHIMU